MSVAMTVPPIMISTEFGFRNTIMLPPISVARSMSCAPVWAEFRLVGRYRSYGVALR